MYFDLRTSLSLKFKGPSGLNYNFYKGQPIHVIESRDIAFFSASQDFTVSTPDGISHSRGAGAQTKPAITSSTLFGEVSKPKIRAQAQRKITGPLSSVEINSMPGPDNTKISVSASEQCNELDKHKGKLVKYQCFKCMKIMGRLNALSSHLTYKHNVKVAVSDLKALFID